MKVNSEYLQGAIKLVDKMRERLSLDEAIANVAAVTMIPWIVLTRYYLESKDPTEKPND